MLKHRCEEMKRNRVYKANISESILDKNTFQVSDQPLPQLLRVSFLIYEQVFDQPLPQLERVFFLMYEFVSLTCLSS